MARKSFPLASKPQTPVKRPLELTSDPQFHPSSPMSAENGKVKAKKHKKPKLSLGEQPDNIIQAQPEERMSEDRASKHAKGKKGKNAGRTMKTHEEMYATSSKPAQASASQAASESTINGKQTRDDSHTRSHQETPSTGEERKSKKKKKKRQKLNKKSRNTLVDAQAPTTPDIPVDQPLELLPPAQAPLEPMASSSSVNPPTAPFSDDNADKATRKAAKKAKEQKRKRKRAEAEATEQASNAGDESLQKRPRVTPAPAQLDEEEHEASPIPSPPAKQSSDDAITASPEKATKRQAKPVETPPRKRAKRSTEAVQFEVLVPPTKAKEKLAKMPKEKMSEKMKGKAKASSPQSDKPNEPTAKTKVKAVQRASSTPQEPPPTLIEPDSVDANGVMTSYAVRSKASLDGITKPRTKSRGKIHTLEEAALDEKRRVRRDVLKWEAQTYGHRFILINRTLDYKDLRYLVKEIGLEHKKGHFSKAEDATILEALDAYQKREGMSGDDMQALLYGSHRRAADMRRKHLILCRELASKLEGRPNVQVRNRVKLLKHPQHRHGHWTVAEDEMLKVGVSELGSQWQKIGEKVGRTGKDCFARYTAISDHTNAYRLGPWTEQEQEDLYSFVTKSKERNPETYVEWPLVAIELGNHRHPRAYLLMYHILRRRRMYGDAGPSKRIRKGKGKQEKEAQDSSASLSTVKGTRKRKQSVDDELDDDLDKMDFMTDDFLKKAGFSGKADMEEDGWSPSLDDITLFQRIKYQGKTKEHEIEWDKLAFGSWDWSADILKEKYRQALARRVPPSWTTYGRSMKAMIDKVIASCSKDLPKEGGKKKAAVVEEEDEDADDPSEVEMLEDEENLPTFA